MRLKRGLLFSFILSITLIAIIFLIPQTSAAETYDCSVEITIQDAGHVLVYGPGAGTPDCLASNFDQCPSGWTMTYFEGHMSSEEGYACAVAYTDGGRILPAYCTFICQKDYTTQCGYKCDPCGGAGPIECTDPPQQKTIACEQGLLSQTVNNPDCSPTGGCTEIESVCDDGIDNDCDGEIDCADVDCKLDKKICQSTQCVGFGDPCGAEYGVGCCTDQRLVCSNPDSGLCGCPEGQEFNETTGICEKTLEATCTLTSASWSKQQAIEGDEVELIVTGNNCDGASLEFQVKKHPSGDSASTKPANAVFSGNTATGTWTTEWSGDASEIPIEYYFRAKVVGIAETISSGTDAGELLEVYSSLYCDSVHICGNYDEQNTCNSNLCGGDIASASIDPGQVDCGEPGITCACEWDSDSNVCEATWSVGGYCGDGIIQTDLGEECDGENLANYPPLCIGLPSFGFTGGNITCDSSCKIDRSQCIGGPTGGSCGDEIIQSPNNNGKYESCDGANITVNCSHWDQTGEISCTSSCAYDLSGCTGGISSKIGKCTYKQTSDDTCEDDGFLTFSWTAVWAWDTECDATCQADNADKEAACTDGQKTVECPAQILLPFFDVYNLLIAIAIIGLIYWAISVEKGKGRKSVKRKKK